MLIKPLETVHIYIFSKRGPGFNTSKVTIELNIHKGLTSLSQNVYHNENATNKKNGHF